MIRSFSHKGLKRFAERGDASKLPVQNAARIRRMLLTLHEASEPESMNLPGWRFHELTGDRAGTYSVQITGNWHLTFAWNDGAVNVDIEDYH